MARTKRFEAELRAAEALRHAPDPGGIRSALAHRSGMIVAPAARAAVAHRIDDLEPQMLAALDRLYRDPVEHDPQCLGKLALVAALDELGCGETAPFLRAAHHVQLEPVWGGTQDSAPPLRIRAAQALVRLGHHGIYRLLGDLLVDPVGAVRGAAAQMLGAIGGERAALLLRLRLTVGDADVEVLPDYAAGLLASEGVEGVPLVVTLLDHDDRAVVGGAALALGGSRLAEALEPLLAALRGSTDRQLTRTLVDAIALQRSDASADVLLGLVADGDREEAVAAAEGLRLYRDRPATVERAKAALAVRGLSPAWIQD